MLIVTQSYYVFQILDLTIYGKSRLDKKHKLSHSLFPLLLFDAIRLSVSGLLTSVLYFRVRLHLGSVWLPKLLRDKHRSLILKFFYDPQKIIYLPSFFRSGIITLKITFHRAILRWCDEHLAEWERILTFELYNFILSRSNDDYSSHALPLKTWYAQDSLLDEQLLQMENRYSISLHNQYQSRFSL